MSLQEQIPEPSRHPTSRVSLHHSGDVVLSVATHVGDALVSPELVAQAETQFPGPANARARALMVNLNLTDDERVELVAWSLFPGMEWTRARELYMQKTRTEQEQSELDNAFRNRMDQMD